MLYLEVRNSLVFSLNGRNTTGSFDPSKQEFAWTPDSQAPDTVVKGTFESVGDEMTLKGTKGSDNIEIMLQRVGKEPS
jgi:hypothetical protein